MSYNDFLLECHYLYILSSGIKNMNIHEMGGI